MQLPPQYLPLALLIFAAGWLGSFFMQLGLLLIAVWSLINWRDVWGELKHNRFFWLSVLAIFYLVFHYLLLDTGIEFQKAEKELKGNIQLWFYPLLGYAIYRSKLPVIWILLVVAVGLTLRILTHTDWMDLPVFIKTRQGFGMAIIGIGLYSGLIIAGLLIFIRRFWFANRTGKFWSVLFWWIIILSSCFCWVLSLSRGAWIATAVGLIVAVILWLKIRGAKTLISRPTLVVLIAFLLLVSLVGSIAYPKLKNRLLSDPKAYSSALTLDREKIPYSSAGIRIHMILYGKERWQEKPLLGWGQGSVRTLLDEDDRLGSWPHFHNSFLQVGVELGAVGLLLFTFAFIMLVKELNRAHRNNSLPDDMYIFLLSAWVMLLVWSLFDTRMIHSDERLLLLGLSAVSFHYLLYDRSKNNSQKPEDNH